MCFGKVYYSWPITLPRKVFLYILPITHSQKHTFFFVSLIDFRSTWSKNWAISHFVVLILPVIIYRLPLDVNKKFQHGPLCAKLRYFQNYISSLKFIWLHGMSVQHTLFLLKCNRKISVIFSLRESRLWSTSALYMKSLLISFCLCFLFGMYLATDLFILTTRQMNESCFLSNQK